nr:MAG TPA: hypothetical protein [Caudoviricetes sp.]
MAYCFLFICMNFTAGFKPQRYVSILFQSRIYYPSLTLPLIITSE